MNVDEEFLLHSKTAISQEDIKQFLEHIKGHKISHEVIGSSLQNPHVTRYFKFNVSQYCELLNVVVTKVESVDEFAYFLKNEGIFQKSIRERTEFCDSFFETLASALVETSLKFSENERVFQETSVFVKKCIFSPKEICCYLTDIFERRECTESHNSCKSFFKFLSSFESTDLQKHAFKLFFNAFSLTNKNFDTFYKMLIVLIEIIGFNIKEGFALEVVEYQIRKPTLSKSLQILNNILSIVVNSKINLQHSVNEVTFSDFLKKLLLSIVALSQNPNTFCYQIILKIIEIHPIILESTVNEILIYVMLSDNTSYKREYEAVMIKIFEVFSKLHRLQNMIAKMIPTLKNAFENKVINDTEFTFKGKLDLKSNLSFTYSIDDILPKTVLEYFTQCIANLASWQVINLFQSLLYHLGLAVEELPVIKKENIYIEMLSCVTCWLLLSARIAEHTVAESSLMKFVGRLEELKIILGKFGVTLLQREHNHILMRSFLNISYLWAEIYITIEYYSNNEQIKMTRIVDNNLSSSNLAYLHSYLSDKEWCLIAERINNFGEQPCKQIMQKLLIQKYRALVIFNDQTDELLTPIIRTLSTEFNPDFIEIYSDPFIINNVLEKFPTNVLTDFAETIIKDFIDNKGNIIDRPHVQDSQLITKSILNVIFMRLNKVFKQKRKYDETTVRKAILSKILALLSPEMFLADNIEEIFKNITELIIDHESNNLDIKIQEEKLLLYLNILNKLPIIFCNEKIQKLTVLLLLSLHKDINNSNCKEEINKKCESFIISIIQHSKFTLFDLLDSGILIKIFVEFFDRSEDIFLQVAQNAFKNDSTINDFQSGITYIKDNLKNEKCLRLAIILVHQLNKAKKNKISIDSKEICSKYKSELCQKIAKMILKNKPEDRFIEGYALALKTFLVKDESDTLTKLKNCLGNYAEFCLENLSDINLKGSLILFTTILHNKVFIESFNNDFILRVWNCMKSVNISAEIIEDYSQLLMLITTLIPNEQFSNIFVDLLENTEKFLNTRNDEEFSKYLKTWSFILSTNFNATKTNILREQLELLLEKLILFVDSSTYQEELFEQVLQFKISIIQANHVPLTGSIIDFLLLSVLFLMMKQNTDFIGCFNGSISILENLLKYRNALIMDRLPPYLMQFRVLLNGLCNRHKLSENILENEARKLADCAHKLEKLTKNLVEYNKDMSRIAMYLIADILSQYEEVTLYPIVKKHLDNCIYSLISLCDHHAVQYLMRALSNAATEIFKFMYENYKKYYRFTGKV